MRICISDIPKAHRQINLTKSIYLLVKNAVYIVEVWLCWILNKRKEDA